MMMAQKDTVRFLLLLWQLASFALAHDFLFATGGTVGDGTILYRFDDAGFGERVALGRLQIQGTTNANFAVSGLVFDYNADLRPAGSLFLLVSPDSGDIYQDLVLEITNPFGLVPPTAGNPLPIIDAAIYGSAFGTSVGLAVTDQSEVLSWRLGDGFTTQDDLISIVERQAGSTLFPKPNEFSLNSGIQTETTQAGRSLVGYDFRRDENQNREVHMIFFDSNNSPLHTYYVVDLTSGEGSFRSSGVQLQPESRCYLGSMNPNVDGEFWCIQDVSTTSVSRNTLIRIDLTASPPMEVGRETIQVPDLTGIAFSYDTTQAPTISPSSEPSSEPSAAPTSEPSQQPSAQPSSVPSATPTAQPTAAPSESPTLIPSEVPSAKPSRSPSRSPSESPTSSPTSVPSATPTEAPTSEPSAEPTSLPSSTPSVTPTSMPSSAPIDLVSATPTLSIAPSEEPTSIPSEEPSAKPSRSPSKSPSESPTASPSHTPSRSPSAVPTAKPSSQPSGAPSAVPTDSPTTMADNACSTNDCSLQGFLPGALMNSNIFGTCVSRCVVDALESVYLDAGWNCGACP